MILKQCTRTDKHLLLCAILSIMIFGAREGFCQEKDEQIQKKAIELVNGLSNEDPEVRAAAFEGILRGWKNWGEEDMKIISDCAQKGGGAGSLCKEAEERIMIRRAVPRLFEAWNDVDWKIRQGAWEEVLQKVDKLLKEKKALDEDAKTVCDMLIEKSGREGATKVAQIYQLTMYQETKLFRSAVHLYTVLLKDSDPSTRIGSIRALLKLQAKDRAKEVVELLKDPVPAVRQQAIAALNAMQAKDYTKDIAGLLKDSHSFVRAEVVRALGEFCANEYAKEISRMLTDPNEQCLDAARSALYRLKERGNSKECAKKVAELLDDSNADVRRAGITALNILHAFEHTQAISKLLTDPDSRVRREAVGTVGWFGPKEHMGEISKLLKDEDSNVRFAVVNILGAFRTKENARVISELLEDSVSEVRSAAAHVLGRFRAREYAKNISSLLEDDDEKVRLSALYAIGRLQAKEYAKEISKMVGDGSKKVSFAARIALIRIDSLPADEQLKLLKSMPLSEISMGKLNELILALNYAHESETMKRLETEVRIEADIANFKGLAALLVKCGVEVTVKGRAVYDFKLEIAKGETILPALVLEELPPIFGVQPGGSSGVIYIAESGRITITSTADATEYWKNRLSK